MSNFEWLKDIIKNKKLHSKKTKKRLAIKHEMLVKRNPKHPTIRANGWIDVKKLDFSRGRQALCCTWCPGHQVI